MKNHEKYNTDSILQVTENKLIVLSKDTKRYFVMVLGKIKVPIIGRHRVRAQSLLTV